MIVVTGPAGNTGRQVVVGLRQRNIQFRALVRSEARARQLAEQGIATVLAEFNQPDTLVAARTGASKAFLVCTPDERLIRCEQNFIRAAKQAGVSHIVKCGAHSAAHDSQSPNLRMHAEVEDALRDSGLDYTIIRPHGFTARKNKAGFSRPVRGSGLRIGPTTAPISAMMTTATVEAGPLDAHRPSWNH